MRPLEAFSGSNSFLPMVPFRTKRVAMARRMAIGRLNQMFLMYPAMMKDTKETPATVSAYGSCVLTWFR